MAKAVELSTSVVESLQRKAVQTLTNRMSQEGLWLSYPALGRFLQLALIRGQKLAESLIEPLLESEDYRYLSGPREGNTFFRNPRMRIPRVVVFGYDLGMALAAADDADANVGEAAGRLCALFNFGIALFDRFGDRFDGSAGTLAEIFDGAMLGGLPGRAAMLKNWERAQKSAHNHELRALMSVVGAFFSGLREFAGRTGRTDGDWKHLNKLLTEAYRAEIRTLSTNRTRTTRRELLAAARRKSILPFQIMLAIARLPQKKCDRQKSAKLTLLVEQIGLAFALIDDLMDFGRDYRRGDANTILLQANVNSLPARRGERGSRNEAGQGWEWRLEQTTEQIISALKTCVVSGQILDHRVEQPAFRTLLLGYTQSWLGSGGLMPRIGGPLACQRQ